MRMLKTRMFRFSMKIASGTRLELRVTPQLSGWVDPEPMSGQTERPNGDGGCTGPDRGNVVIGPDGELLSVP
jgi:hypothetical protein